MPSSSGLLALGLSRTDLPIYGGVLIPSPDLTMAIASDSNGASSVQTDWSAVPPGLHFYGQALFLDDGASQGISMSNGIGINTFENVGEAESWKSMATEVEDTIGKLLSTRDATDVEIGLLFDDLRVAILGNHVADNFPLAVDVTKTEVSSYQVPGGIGELAVVPLISPDGGAA